MSSTDLRQQVLQEALMQLEAWQRRYAHLTELSEIFTVIRLVKQRRKKAS
jgi:hypothetical protein